VEVTKDAPDAAAEIKDRPAVSDIHTSARESVSYAARSQLSLLIKERQVKMVGNGVDEVRGRQREAVWCPAPSKFGVACPQVPLISVAEPSLQVICLSAEAQGLSSAPSQMPGCRH
jgi:hypothetical protein